MSHSKIQWEVLGYKYVRCEQYHVDDVSYAEQRDDADAKDSTGPQGLVDGLAPTHQEPRERLKHMPTIGQQLC